MHIVRMFVAKSTHEGIRGRGGTSSPSPSTPPSGSKERAPEHFLNMVMRRSRRQGKANARKPRKASPQMMPQNTNPAIALCSAYLTPVIVSIAQNFSAGGHVMAPIKPGMYIFPPDTGQRYQYALPFSCPLMAIWR